MYMVLIATDNAYLRAYRIEQWEWVDLDLDGMGLEVGLDALMSFLNDII